MSCFGWVYADVQDRFSCLKKIDGILGSCWGAGEYIGVVHKLGRGLLEEAAAGVAR